MVSGIVDRVARHFLAARGLQVRRKDKDLMQDTGGVSKGREREPHGKPPRDDNKNRYKPKKIPKDDKKDQEKDPDKPRKKRRASED